MSARSRYVQINEMKFTDRRGAVRTVKVKTGFNKGKRYPYAGAKRGG